MIFTTGVIAAMQCSRGGREIHITHGWETLAPAYKGTWEKKRWTYMSWQFQMSSRHQNYWSPSAIWGINLGSTGCFSIWFAHWSLEHRYCCQLPGLLIWVSITNSMKMDI